MTSITKIINIAKAVRETVTVDGETFYFAAVGCEESQVEKLSEKGFHLMTDPTYDRGRGALLEEGALRRPGRFVPRHVKGRCVMARGCTRDGARRVRLRVATANLWHELNRPSWSPAPAKLPMLIGK